MVSLNSSSNSPYTRFTCCSSEFLRLASKRESTFSSRSFIFTALQLNGYLLLAIASCLDSIRGRNSANLQPFSYESIIILICYSLVFSLLQPFGNSISFAVVLAIQTGTVLGILQNPDWTRTCLKPGLEK